MICKDRVVVVTGAGRGLGRAHALEFARQGAKVVVNDLGVSASGEGGSEGPAHEVVEEIRAMGGEAVADGSDIATDSGARRLVATALKSFGGLDVLVNNAGFLRDRMLVNMSEEEWDAVMRVHLKGHFLPLKHAGLHWRAEAKAGRPVDARVINTSSGAGLLGSVGQGNYSAAKAGIVGLTLVAAAELGRYGVTVNAIAPAARTRMTEQVFAATMAAVAEGAFDAMAPENVSPLVAWLGSAESRDVTGRVFEVEGGKVCVMEGFRHGPTTDIGARWDAADLGPEITGLLREAATPEPVYGA
ncbi:SDR family oxidoreductase [Streptosporangium carneum]|uniref:Short-chain dehydrogenase/reductase n=1 Tax=Streptosporangium carneum TaxID=47481 RepID=A0A9W6IAV9_9ACTN|nr:SDR family oxidoreductase [Streptosporangium carneum]GLK14793.1 putative short-chain dehydrogenase/reductase [Streptosporangium carneum]